MAVPVARRDGTGLRAGRDQGRQGHLLDRLAEVASSCRTASPPARRAVGQCPRRSGRPAPAPTAATTPTMRRWTARCWPRRSASRCACNTCASKAPAGTRRARPRSTAPARRSTPRATSSPTSSHSKGFSRVDVNTNGSKPFDTLAGQTLGVGLESGDGFGVPAESYAFDNKRTGWETIPPLLDRSSPLRTSHLRDPVGPQIHFASESFMDEVAAALDQDPIEFRLKYIKDPRDQASAQGRGAEVRLGHAAVAAQGPDRRQGHRPRHRLLRSATAPAWR